MNEISDVNNNENNNPNEEPSCTSSGMRLSCIREFKAIRKTQEEHGETLTLIKEALVPDNPYNRNKGLVETVADHSKKIKRLERVYVWGAAVVALAGVVITIGEKLGIKITF